MRDSIGNSEINCIGLFGSYIGRHESIGQGFLVGEVVYRSGGNGWYYPVEVAAFAGDGGSNYVAAVGGRHQWAKAQILENNEFLGVAS